MPVTASNLGFQPDMTARGMGIQIEGWHAQNCLLIEELKTPRIVTSYSYDIATDALGAVTPFEKVVNRTSADVLAAWKPEVDRDPAKRIFGGSPDSLIRNFEDLERVNNDLLLAVSKLTRTASELAEDGVTITVLGAILEEYAAIGAELSKLRLSMQDKPSQLADVITSAKTLGDAIRIRYLSPAESSKQLFNHHLRTINGALEIGCAMRKICATMLPDTIGVTTNAPQSCDVHHHSCVENASEEMAPTPEELNLQSALSSLQDAAQAWTRQHAGKSVRMSLSSTEFFATTTLLLDFAIDQRHIANIRHVCDLVVSCANYELDAACAGAGSKLDLVVWKREDQRLLPVNRKKSEWERSKDYREILKSPAKQNPSIVLQSYMRFWGNEEFSCELMKQMNAAEDASLACKFGARMALTLLRRFDAITPLQVYYCCMLLQRAAARTQGLASLGNPPESRKGSEWEHVAKSLRRTIKVGESTAVELLALVGAAFKRVGKCNTMADEPVEIVLVLLHLKSAKVISLACEIISRLTITTVQQSRDVNSSLIRRFALCGLDTTQRQREAMMQVLIAVEKHSAHMYTLGATLWTTFWTAGHVISMCDLYPRGYEFWLESISTFLSDPQNAGMLRYQAYALNLVLKHDTFEANHCQKISFFVFVAMHHDDCSMTHWFVNDGVHFTLCNNIANDPHSEILANLGHQNVIWMLQRAIQYMASRGMSKSIEELKEFCEKPEHPSNAIFDAVLAELAPGGAALVATAKGCMPPPPLLTPTSFKVERPLPPGTVGGRCFRWEVSIHFKEIPFNGCGSGAGIRCATSGKLGSRRKSHQF